MPSRISRESVAPGRTPPADPTRRRPASLIGDGAGDATVALENVAHEINATLNAKTIGAAKHHANLAAEALYIASGHIGAIAHIADFMDARTGHADPSHEKRPRARKRAPKRSAESA